MINEGRLHEIHNARIACNVHTMYKTMDTVLSIRMFLFSLLTADDESRECPGTQRLIAKGDGSLLAAAANVDIITEPMAFSFPNFNEEINESTGRV